MSRLLSVDVVEYECSCGVFSPLCDQYFCRHCCLLRCKQCVSHELSHFFCANCLESMPLAEARLKKNRCTNCYDCPICSCALAIRATSVVPQDKEKASADSSNKPPANPHKMYYFACNYCRWTTRQSGIVDQAQAQANWSDKVNYDEPMLRSILDHFRHLASVEKNERERKKFSKRRNMGHFYSDKYGMKALIARKKAGINTEEKEETETNLNSLVPSEDVEPLDDAIFEQQLDLTQVTTISQRHRASLVQPINVAKLFPIRRELLVKKSLRCMECDHNLCKGEFNPTSTKFKIQLFGILHAPQIRLLKPPEIIKDKPFNVELTLTNLGGCVMHVVLLPNLNYEGVNYAKPEIPSTEINLSVRDETVDTDCKDENDEPMILWRKGHKAAVTFKCTVQETKGNIMLALVLKHDYMNLVAEDSNQPKLKWLHQNVMINLNHASQS